MQNHLLRYFPILEREKIHYDNVFFFFCLLLSVLCYPWSTNLFSLLKACSLIKKTQQGICACEAMIDVISCDTVSGEFLCPSYCTSASKSRSLLKSLESLQSSSSVSLASKSGHSVDKTANLDFSQLWFSPCLWMCFLISYRKKSKYIFFK